MVYSEVTTLDHISFWW